MKKLICILASAALLGACEQKTETVAPAEKKIENSPTVVSTPTAEKRRSMSTSAIAPSTRTEPKTEAPDTLTTAAPPDTSTETKTDTTTTTTTASPNP